MRSFLAALPLLALACSKPDPGAAPAASSAPIAVASTPPMMPTTVASVAPSAMPSSSAEPVTEGPGDAGPATCGTKPLPDCPLQAWMKSHANPPVMTSNLPALATALDDIVKLAPPGYPNWVSISKDGAAAARSGDLAAAKAACRTCHDQYKPKYKTELRARKI